MPETVKKSYNFALNPDGHHRGAGDKKDKNVADGSGNITFSSSLFFLYDKAEAMLKDKKKSMLLGILHMEKGYDGVKKRLNSYGLFGKKIQNNAKKFDMDEVENIFLWGQNITSFQVNKIFGAIAAIERYLGDDNANFKNFRKSEKFEDALEMAKTMYMLVIAHYDDSYLNEDENDETRATLSLGYVKFSTGRVPEIAAFEHSTGKDSINEVEWNGQKASDYMLDDEGSISFVTTRSYLKDYKGSDNQNLKLLSNRENPDQTFWTANLFSFTPEEIPASFAASFSEEIREEMKKSTRIVFNYVFGQFDERNINSILNYETDGDAKVVFSGNISQDISNPKRVNIYKGVNDETQEEYQIFTFRLRQGTFYTQKLID